MSKTVSEQPSIVTGEEWLEARQKLLQKEKELTRARDEVNTLRRQLPWTRVEKSYLFDTEHGQQSLADLFDGRSQLIVQHFMFAPGWGQGCIGCSFKSDSIDGTLPHLEHHDVTFVSISRAPLDEILAYKKRMGWHFKWVSSFNNDFNYDFHVSFRKPPARAGGKVYYNYAERDFPGEEISGASIFFKDESGAIFHTYSTFGRGDELLVGSYMYLDLTPKGRNEHGPHHNLMDWVKRHDDY